ncbi:hypothetical protein GNI_007610, partial [Gregarina niphandrodes]
GTSASAVRLKAKGAAAALRGSESSSSGSSGWSRLSQPSSGARSLRRACHSRHPGSTAHGRRVQPPRPAAAHQLLQALPQTFFRLVASGKYLAALNWDQPTLQTVAGLVTNRDRFQIQCRLQATIRPGRESTTCVPNSAAENPGMI